MDEGKRGNLGCISSCFWALRGAPRVTDGWLRVSGYRLGRWKWQRRFRCNLAMWWPQTKRKPHLEKCNFHWFSAIFSGLVAVSTLSLILMKKSLYHDYLFFYSFLLTLSIIPEGPHMNFYLRRSPLCTFLSLFLCIFLWLFGHTLFLMCVRPSSHGPTAS